MSVDTPIRLLRGESLAGRMYRLLDPYGNLIDLSGGTAHMSVRRTPAESAILDLTTENGGIVIDSVVGTIEPVASAATIAAIAPIVARYDLFYTDTAGRRFLVAEGIFSVAAAYTGNP